MTRDFETRPALVYERLRSRYGQVAPVDVFGARAWLVLGFREVREVMRDDTLWKKDMGNWRALREGRVPSDWPLMASQDFGHMLLRDDERHKRTRQAVDSALMPFQDPGKPQAWELDKAVSQYMDELITFFAEGGTSGWVDLCAQVARPLPLMVLNRLFGFPVEQGDDIFMDSWRMVDAGPDAAAAAERLVKATTELAAYKKSHPGDDLTTRLLAADPLLSVEQVGIELYAILVIMSELVGHSITNSVLEVLTGNPSVRVSLTTGHGDELVNRVHLATPPWTNCTFRFPVADTVLGDFRLAAGDAVMASIAAAHGDPLFLSAIDQEASKSSRAHLAWGTGVHQCPGRGLADMMVTTAVSRLFERCDFELGLSVDQLPWRSSTYVRGLRSFPVRFQMREAMGATARSAPSAGAATDSTAPEPVAAATPAEQDRPRPGLWRFLASLRRGGQS
ncbi:cytochrome P450 [Streptomyces sp. NPDC059679]|uniref:cytochrome P450 n=1 Tax=Streptomyces sp. NPDC059679 TaxID=3346903 RepID=UPI0036AA8313